MAIHNHASLNNVRISQMFVSAILSILRNTWIEQPAFHKVLASLPKYSVSNDTKTIAVKGYNEIWLYMYDLSPSITTHYTL